MAANDELPRGLTLSSGLVAAQASVTFPAVAGVTWVLTAAKLILLAVGSIAGGDSKALEANTTILGYASLPVPSSINNTGEDEWQGQDAFTAPGAALVVQSSGFLANTGQVIIASAFPI